MIAISVAAAGLTGGCLLVDQESRTQAPASTVPPTTAPTTSTTEPPAQVRYTVVRGDTLIKIADRFGVDLNRLAAANNIADPTLIFPGDSLIIPPPPDPDAGPALTIAPATDPVLPPLLPTTTAPPVTVAGSG